VLLLAAACHAEESSGFVLLSPEEAAARAEIKASCQSESAKYFSVAAMFIGFREAVEGCVIISVRCPTVHIMTLPCLHQA
jgi:hypothetical protein